MCYVIFCGILWYSVVFCGILWYSVIFHMLWYSVICMNYRVQHSKAKILLDYMVFG